MKTKLLIYKIVGKAIPYLAFILCSYLFVGIAGLYLIQPENIETISKWFVVILIALLLLTFGCIMTEIELRDYIYNYRGKAIDSRISDAMKEHDEIMKRWNDTVEWHKSYLDKYEALKKYSDNPYILGDLSKETMFLIYNRCMELMSNGKPDAIGIIDIELTHDVVDFVRSLNFGLHRMSNQAWVLTYKKEISL
jgi:hypothetical protein